MKRFKETGQVLYDFTYLFLVRCPQCDKCAEVVLRDKVNGRIAGTTSKRDSYLFAPRRLVCTGCGYNKDWEGNKVASNDTRDWYFRQPLWLQIPCCGEVLWALNEDHLNYLEEFVAAGLREVHSGGTIASRLPGWMKIAKNREDVLKCINKLRTMLPASTNRRLPN